MATTDARPGFKLPWSADRTESDSNDAAETAAPSVSEAPPAATVEHPDTADASSSIDGGAGHMTAEPADGFDPWRLSDAAPAPLDATPRRKPNKLMADLTKAMQTAAESARDETLERLQADAKAHVETIHARSATESEELRHAADADIAGIREWSKAEIARIREETDLKVTDRKAMLETDLESHAARIEQRIERVQSHVAWFEAEMAGFFERLLAEEDPTHLAAMAENLPEPPSFDDLEELPEPPAPATAVADVAVADPGAEPVEASDTTDGDEPAADVEVGSEVAAPVEDAEAAFAAIQASAEAAEAGEAVESADTGAEASAAYPSEDIGEAAVPESEDPRIAALGLPAEEAVTEATATPAEGGEDLATFSDDALAARLAGLVPAEGDVAPVDLHTTRVVVTGLVSVASIAGFKRHLGKLEGVASVGVSSGPDGEFVFAVSHDPSVDLRQAVPALPGFAAQVTSATDDTVSVAARDPETES